MYVNPATLPPQLRRVVSAILRPDPAPYPELKGLTGLRGLLAVYIMMHHCFAYSEWKAVKLLGYSLMPTFYAMSGFTLTVLYGKQVYMGTRGMCDVEPPREEVGGEGAPPGTLYTDETTEEPVWFENGAFMKRRVARIVPLYLLANLLCLPLTFSGYGIIPARPVFYVPSLFTTFSFTSSLFIGIFSQWTFCPPAWTICTLMILYLFFPAQLLSYQKQRADIVHRKVVLNFWTQASLSCLIYLIFFLLGLAEAGAWFTTVNPLLRIFIFNMGIGAGVLRLRDSDLGACSSGDQDVTEPYAVGLLRVLPGWHTDLPCGCGDPYDPAVNREDSMEMSGDETASGWLERKSGGVLFMTILMCFAILLASLADWDSSWYIQIFTSHTQLLIVIGLTYTGGTAKSGFASMCCSTVCQFLGKISMALYLIHVPVIQYLCLLLYGEQAWHDECLSGPITDTDYYLTATDNGNVNGTSSTFSYASQSYTDPAKLEVFEYCQRFWANRELPAWSILVVPLVSIPLAYGLHVGFEVPLRMWLSGRKSTDASS